MCRAALSFVLAVWAILPALAADPVTPSPAFEPKHVVELQLDGLRQNDDAGIAQAWAFAHPENKKLTGPLPRFANLLRSPAYRILLGHRAHQIDAVSQSDEEAIFAVSVTGPQGNVVVYRWVLSKVGAGEFAGAWMTTAVSPPVSIGSDI